MYIDNVLCFVGLFEKSVAIEAIRYGDIFKEASRWMERRSNRDIFQEASDYTIRIKCLYQI